MLKHNAYFDGKVQSIGFERHGLAAATVGVIGPGGFHFSTGAAGALTIISGELRARLAGGDWHQYPAGTNFEFRPTAVSMWRPRAGRSPISAGSSAADARCRGRLRRRSPAYP
ncbi:MAG: pyrimidine/purine nucleoside phosphorylase [Steroidobacteraceae bacterium]